MTPAKRGLALDTPSPAGSVAEPPEGIAWIPWLDLLAPPPIPEIPEAPGTTTAPPFDADPMVGAFGRSDASAPVGVHWRSPEVDGGQVGGTPGVANPPTRTPRHRRRIEALAFAAALVLLVGGAIAGADILSNGGQDPTLENAITYRDADAPGLRFTFVDPTVPETRIEQYVGRTTAGRPLTITVTVREPRTAPTSAELDALLASVRAI